jgi:hypothetical protein
MGFFKIPSILSNLNHLPKVKSDYVPIFLSNSQWEIIFSPGRLGETLNCIQLIAALADLRTVLHSDFLSLVVTFLPLPSLFLSPPLHRYTCVLAAGLAFPDSYFFLSPTLRFSSPINLFHL